VAKGGEICVNVLKRDWARDLGLRHVLLVVRCLLVEPFPESALNEEAGKLLLESYAAYAAHAALLTSIHAQPAKRCAARSVVNSSLNSSLLIMRRRRRRGRGRGPARCQESQGRRQGSQARA